MKVFSWNMRGLANYIKRASVKEVIRKNRSDLAFFQETKLRPLNSTTVYELWGSSSMDWVCLDADGSSRGILVVWNSIFIMKKGVWVGSFSISVVVEDLDKKSYWIATFVYGPNDGELRRFL